MELQDGEILLLENLRFHKEEEKNDPAFAKQLASLAELYVSDAFGTVHRAHASTAGVAAYLPAVAGFLIGKELSVMGAALGLIGGKFLLDFVMSQIKIDMVWFAVVAEPISYVWSISLTLLSALIVDFVFYFRLDKSNMAEALKSVE